MIELYNIGVSEEEISNMIDLYNEIETLEDEDVLKTLNKLKDLGYDDLNILIDSDPYILSLEEYEIKSYLEEENYEEN